jgi:hypothetical protein
MLTNTRVEKIQRKGEMSREEKGTKGAMVVGREIEEEFERNKANGAIHPLDPFRIPHFHRNPMPGILPHSGGDPEL